MKKVLKPGGLAHEEMIFTWVKVQNFQNPDFFKIKS